MTIVINSSQTHPIMTTNIKNSLCNTLNNFTNTVLNIEEQKEVKGGTIIIEDATEH